MSKIALGSAQFGLNYGISNVNGMLTKHEVESIIALAVNRGVEFIDTAHSYGNSEEVLGEIIDNAFLANKFFINTKVPKIPATMAAEAASVFIDGCINTSLNRLRSKQIYSVMLHDAGCLLGDNGGAIWKKLLEIKRSGVCRKIGISTYQVAEAQEVMAKYDIDIIQIPLNIFDQRFLREGMLSSLKRNGIEIHARSIFLQCLLLTPVSRLNNYFTPIFKKIFELQEEARKSCCSTSKICIDFVSNISEVDRIVVGVTSYQELAQILDEANRDSIIDRAATDKYFLDDERYILPQNWRL